MIGALLLTGFGWNGWIKEAAGKDTPMPAKEMMTETGETMKGTAEFYFSPQDENRTWHVINIYNPASSEGINNSEYTFSADSVTVINEIASPPRKELWELCISGLIFKGN
jgi:hypothetical protein